MTRGTRASVRHRRQVTGADASIVFNGSVIMRGGVIGNQINNQYGPR